MLFALLVLAWPGAARAQTWGQYLVVIDDSGSMDGSDPDRLVMLASLALTATLSDADQIMIVGLNELANGETTSARFVSPRELLAERDGGEGQRALASAALERMAQHQGATPCKQALDRAATILESVAAAGAPQTLLMLTDGACTGPIDPAQTWLGRLRSHTAGQFRFALLSKKQRGERIDPALVAYAAATGWTTDPNISFDARTLLRAFAEVLSFSRGLRFDDGGRVGLARSFAGAHEVRVLAVSTEGRAPISLAFTDASMDSREDPLAGGPTFKHAEFGWSLRVAKSAAHELPFAVRSPDAGVELLIIPSYGALQIEAVVGPCGDQPPPLPWTRERAVRSGQPACAWARLVGDRGETIHPNHSFGFELELCQDAACTTPSAMQPDQDGSFNAQLGIMPEGRSERWFRARGGALATPLMAQRGIQAVAFGITAVARAAEPDTPIEGIELGVLPQALPQVITLELSGSFPDGAEANVRCEIAGDAGQTNLLAGELACLRCVPTPAVVALQDPFTLQVEIQASSSCPMISDKLGELPVALDLSITPTDPASKIGARRVPIRALLRHAIIEPQTAQVTGGQAGETTLRFPSPVNANVELSLEPNGPLADDVAKDLAVTLAQTTLRLTSEPGGVAEVGVSLTATDCCSAGDYPFTLHVRDTAGGPQLDIPVTVSVLAPSFWVCPGKTILKWTLVALGIGLLIWLIRGFTSPAKFAQTAVLARAESHESLAKLTEGDEDWRLIAALEPTKRGFYTPATVHLGGPKAALPSLRELPANARIEARGNDNASLVVEAEGIETFKESSGWQPLPVGEQPIGSSIVLRRDDTYLMFRR
ncbi:hypothetical protein DB30_01124 [Enhygromyxa salina]|uniref:VWFA domain-containing protein n=1 Tax=Enhygromyxa salina TaxID=215803 RepID=A0A0C2CXY2_9BACT|nr:hypothetical protein DB30_01124 [Enhygromyxa salina]